MNGVHQIIKLDKFASGAKNWIMNREVSVCIGLEVHTHNIILHKLCSLLNTIMIQKFLIYRLTMQTAGTFGCEVLEQCITPVSISSGDGRPGFLDAPNLEISSAESDYNYYHDDDEHGSGVDGLQGNDSHGQNNQSVPEDHAHTEVTTFEPKPTCLIDQETLRGWNFYWVPVCDCFGYYKLIQCIEYGGSNTVCWCSTKLGGEIAHTRKKLVCSDPEQL